MNLQSTQYRPVSIATVYVGKCNNSAARYVTTPVATSQLPILTQHIHGTLCDVFSETAVSLKC